MFPFPAFTPKLASSLVSAHRYWRVYITANNVDTYTSINEIELYDGLPGKNIAPTATVSSLSDWSGYAVSNTVSGILGKSDLWITASMPSWVQFDFGAGNEKAIYGVGLHARYQNSTQNVKDFSLQWSDNGSTWTTLLTPASQTSWVEQEMRRFYITTLPTYTGSPWGAHSYWRLAVKLSNVDFPGMTELQFRATPSGADQATGGTAAASSIYSGTYVASNAFDGNSSTFWIGSGQDTGWIRYDFPSAVQVSQILLRARTDGNPQNTPNRFSIQFADSTSGPWTTAFDVVSGADSYTNGESRVFTDPLYI